MEEVKIATKGAMLVAKKELLQLDSTVTLAMKSADKVIKDVDTACNSITTSKHVQVASALREDVEKRGMSHDTLFAELAGSADRIPEDAFCRHLEK